MISNKEDTLEWLLLSPKLIYERQRYFLDYEEEMEYQEVKKYINTEEYSKRTKKPRIVKRHFSRR